MSDTIIAAWIGGGFTVIGLIVMVMLHFIKKEDITSPMEIATFLMTQNKVMADENQKLKEDLAQALSNVQANTSAAEMKVVADNLYDGDTTRVEQILDKIIDDHKESISVIAEAYRNKGMIVHLFDTQKSITYYKRSLELDPNSLDGWNQLGHLLDRIGELEQAETAYKKVLSLSEAINDKEGIAVAYGNLGLIFSTRGDLDKAEEYHRKSFEIFSNIGAETMVKKVKKLLDELKQS